MNKENENLQKEDKGAGVSLPFSPSSSIPSSFISSSFVPPLGYTPVISQDTFPVSASPNECFPARSIMTLSWGPHNVLALASSSAVFFYRESSLAFPVGKICPRRHPHVTHAYRKAMNNFMSRTPAIIATSASSRSNSNNSNASEGGGGKMGTPLRCSTRTSSSTPRPSIDPPIPSSTPLEAVSPAETIHSFRWSPHLLRRGNFYPCSARLAVHITSSGSVETLMIYIVGRQGGGGAGVVAMPAAAAEYGIWESSESRSAFPLGSVYPFSSQHHLVGGGGGGPGKVRCSRGLVVDLNPGRSLRDRMAPEKVKALCNPYNHTVNEAQGHQSKKGKQKVEDVEEIEEVLASNNTNDDDGGGSGSGKKQDSATAPEAAMESGGGGAATAATTTSTTPRKEAEDTKGTSKKSGRDRKKKEKEVEDHKTKSREGQCKRGRPASAGNAKKKKVKGEDVEDEGNSSWRCNDDSDDHTDGNDEGNEVEEEDKEEREGEEEGREVKKQKRKRKKGHPSLASSAASAGGAAASTTPSPNPLYSTTLVDYFWVPSLPRPSLSTSSSAAAAATQAPEENLPRPPRRPLHSHTTTSSISSSSSSSRQPCEEEKVEEGVGEGLRENEADVEDEPEGEEEEEALLVVTYQGVHLILIPEGLDEELDSQQEDEENEESGCAVPKNNKLGPSPSQYLLALPPPLYTFGQGEDLGAGGCCPSAAALIFPSFSSSLCASSSSSSKDTSPKSLDVTRTRISSPRSRPSSSSSSPPILLLIASPMLLRVLCIVHAVPPFSSSSSSSCNSSESPLSFSPSRPPRVTIHLHALIQLPQILARPSCLYAYEKEGPSFSSCTGLASVQREEEQERKKKEGMAVATEEDDGEKEEGKEKMGTGMDGRRTTTQRKTKSDENNENEDDEGGKNESKWRFGVMVATPGEVWRGSFLVDQGHHDHPCFISSSSSFLVPSRWSCWTLEQHCILASSELHQTDESSSSSSCEEVSVRDGYIRGFTPSPLFSPTPYLLGISRQSVFGFYLDRLLPPVLLFQCGGIGEVKHHYYPYPSSLPTSVTATTTPTRKMDRIVVEDGSGPRHHPHVSSSSPLSGESTLSSTVLPLEEKIRQAFTFPPHSVCGVLSIALHPSGTSGVMLLEQHGPLHTPMTLYPVVANHVSQWFWKWLCALEIESNVKKIGNSSSSSAAQLGNGKNWENEGVSGGGGQCQRAPDLNILSTLWNHLFLSSSSSSFSSLLASNKYAEENNQDRVPLPLYRRITPCRPCQVGVGRNDDDGSGKLYFLWEPLGHARAHKVSLFLLKEAWQAYFLSSPSVFWRRFAAAASSSSALVDSGVWEGEGYPSSTQRTRGGGGRRRGEEEEEWSTGCESAARGEGRSGGNRSSAAWRDPPFYRVEDFLPSGRSRPSRFTVGSSFALARRMIYAYIGLRQYFGVDLFLRFPKPHTGAAMMSALSSTSSTSIAIMDGKRRKLSVLDAMELMVQWEGWGRMRHRRERDGSALSPLSHYAEEEEEDYFTPQDPFLKGSTPHRVRCTSPSTFPAHPSSSPKTTTHHSQKQHHLSSRVTLNAPVFVPSNEDLSLKDCFTELVREYTSLFSEYAAPILSSSWWVLLVLLCRLCPSEASRIREELLLARAIHIVACYFGYKGQRLPAGVCFLPEEDLLAFPHAARLHRHHQADTTTSSPFFTSPAGALAYLLLYWQEKKRSSSSCGGLSGGAEENPQHPHNSSIKQEVAVVEKPQKKRGRRGCGEANALSSDPPTPERSVLPMLPRSSAEWMGGPPTPCPPPSSWFRWLWCSVLREEETVWLQTIETFLLSCTKLKTMEELCITPLRSSTMMMRKEITTAHEMKKEHDSGKEKGNGKESPPHLPFDPSSFLFSCSVCERPHAVPLCLSLSSTVLCGSEEGNEHGIPCTPTTTAASTTATASAGNDDCPPSNVHHHDESTEEGGGGESIQREHASPVYEPHTSIFSPSTFSTIPLFSEEYVLARCGSCGLYDYVIGSFCSLCGGILL